MKFLLSLFKGLFMTKKKAPAKPNLDSALKKIDKLPEELFGSVDISHLSQEEIDKMVQDLDNHSALLDKLAADAPNKSAEENLKDIEDSVKRLEDIIGGSVKFSSLEDFLSQSGTSQIVPFTAIEDFNDARKEMSHHEGMYRMLTDWDLVEELLGFYNKGYEIDGLMELYRKLEKNEDLDKRERTQLEQMYLLVGMDLVYNV